MTTSRNDYRTPMWLFHLLEERYGRFAADAAAQPHNALHEVYGTAERPLDFPWPDRTFCNPPFRDSRGLTCIERWVAHAMGSLSWRRRSVLVLPVGCSQYWFHKVLRCGGAEILCPTRRINFLLPDGTPTKSADRDTHIVSFGYIEGGGPRIASLEVTR